MGMIFLPGQSDVFIPHSGIQIYRPHGLSALYNSLTAFWKLDEASGSRADSIGSSTLTDNNTVTSAAGQVYPTAASFASASTEYLSAVSSSALQLGEVDWWQAAWVRFTTLSADGTIMGKYNPATNSRENAMYYRNSDQRIVLLFSQDGTSGTTGGLTASNFGTPVINTWYFVCSWYDNTANTIYISVNDGTPNSAPSTTSFAGSAAFAIGASQTTSPFLLLNGRVGPAMIGKNYLLTAADRTYLYNSGAGRTLEAMRDY